MYADRFTRIRRAQAARDTRTWNYREPLPLPTVTEAKAALMDQQLRRLNVRPPRRTRSHAQALLLHSCTMIAARRALATMPAGDQAEQVRGDVMAQWQSVAPARATPKTRIKTPTPRRTRAECRHFQHDRRVMRAYRNHLPRKA